ncbi:MAG: hypothetical protein ABI600_02010 [Luteolibacter sp.]
MKTKSSPTQFELTLLAMTLDGDHAPIDRVKLAMAVWDEAGETLFPAPGPRVAISLDQMLERLFPDLGNGKKGQSVKEIKTARMAKYRKFVEWCEWATWGPDYVRCIPNVRDGRPEEISVTKAFVGRNVQAAIKIQGRDGIVDADKVEEEFRHFCSSEKLRREAIYGDRARKAATASHAKKVAAKSSLGTAAAKKRAISPKKLVKKQGLKTR